MPRVAREPVQPSRVGDPDREAARLVGEAHRARGVPGERLLLQPQLVAARSEDVAVADAAAAPRHPGRRVGARQVAGRESARVVEVERHAGADEAPRQLAVLAELGVVHEAARDQHQRRAAALARVELERRGDEVEQATQVLHRVAVDGARAQRHLVGERLHAGRPLEVGRVLRAPAHDGLDLAVAADDAHRLVRGHQLVGARGVAAAVHGLELLRDLLGALGPDAAPPASVLARHQRHAVAPADRLQQLAHERARGARGLEREVRFVEHDQEGSRECDRGFRRGAGRRALPRRGAGRGARARRPSLPDRLEIDDLLDDTVLAHDEVLAPQAAHGLALRIGHDDVHADGLDACGKDRRSLRLLPRCGPVERQQEPKAEREASGRSQEDTAVADRGRPCGVFRATHSYCREMRARLASLGARAVPVDRRATRAGAPSYTPRAGGACRRACSAAWC